MNSSFLYIGAGTVNLLWNVSFHPAGKHYSAEKLFSALKGENPILSFNPPGIKRASSIQGWHMHGIYVPLQYPRQISLINHSEPGWALRILRASGSHYQLLGVGRGAEIYLLSLILFIESPSFSRPGLVNRQPIRWLRSSGMLCSFPPSIVSKCHLSAFSWGKLSAVVSASLYCLTSGPLSTSVLLPSPNRYLGLSSAHCSSIQRALRTFIDNEEYVTEWLSTLNLSLWILIRIK